MLSGAVFGLLQIGIISSDQKLTQHNFWTWEIPQRNKQRWVASTPLWQFIEPFWILEVTEPLAKPCPIGTSTVLYETVSEWESKKSRFNAVQLPSVLFHIGARACHSMKNYVEFRNEQKNEKREMTEALIISGRSTQHNSLLNIKNG